MHCFSEEKHRKEFNTGEKIYINSVQYFHDLEDEFQRDFEGGILRQEPNKNGFFLFSKSNLTADEAINKTINHQLENDELLIPTSDFKIYINGYIFCLTLIPKCYLRIRDNEIVFNENHNIASCFYYLLNQYTKNCKYTYISLYDAQSFMEIFYSQMTNKGYSISYGCVNYEKLSQEQRFKYYSKKDISKLIFTKDDKFDYQNEFRIFLHKPGKEVQGHIEEVGIDLQSSVVKDLVYLSPKYVSELELNKK